MSRTVVITGGGGFVGQWLGRAALERGDRVVLAGLGKKAEPSILSPAEWGDIRWRSCDVRVDADVVALVETEAPDLIVHLAGVSFVPDTERAPVSAYEINVLGAVRVASAASQARAAGMADPLLLVVGSATQYGAHPRTAMPLTEDTPQLPVSAYGATKAAQEMAVLQIGRASGLRVVCTRSFNHSGRGQADMFLIPSLVKRIRAPGSAGALKIGNDVVRDFLHVDDVVAAYLALADRGTAGEVYNVCSGVGVSVRDIATEVVARAGVPAAIESSSELERPGDMPVLVGSPAKLRRATGWQPRKNHTDIINDLLLAP